MTRTFAEGDNYEDDEVRYEMKLQEETMDWFLVGFEAEGSKTMFDAARYSLDLTSFSFALTQRLFDLLACENHGLPLLSASALRLKEQRELEQLLVGHEDFPDLCLIDYDPYDTPPPGYVRACLCGVCTCVRGLRVRACACACVHA